MTTNLIVISNRSAFVGGRYRSAILLLALLLTSGTFRVALAQRDRQGTNSDSLTAPSGKQSRSATSPMGWNSWNHFADKVTDADVRAAADALVASGMRDAGYVYVNIDDTWAGNRDANGNIQSNERFPDMKALVDYVPSKGLKVGIYSSPGPKTCAGYAGSYNHEEQDAKRYADWGFDYLKYDQCSFGDIIRQQAGGDLGRAAAMQREAYDKLHAVLLHTGRPIVFSFCQYGLYAVWKWAAQSGANLWRTTGDIKDDWNRMSLIGFQQAGVKSGTAFADVWLGTTKILQNGAEILVSSHGVLLLQTK